MKKESQHERLLRLRERWYNPSEKSKQKVSELLSKGYMIKEIANITGFHPRYVGSSIIPALRNSNGIYGARK